MLVLSYPVFRSFKIEILSSSQSLFIPNQAINLQTFSILHAESYTHKLGLYSHNMFPVIAEARGISLMAIDKVGGFEIVPMDT